MLILVVSEPTMFRDGLGLLLQARLPGSELVCAETVQRAVANRRSATPAQLVLVDLSLPDVGARQGLETIATNFVGTPLIGLADDRSQPEIRRALGLGARMCVLKSASGDDFLAALHLADSNAICLPGQGWIGKPQEGVPVEIRAPRGSTKTTPADLGLTPKQQRVLHLLLQGMSAKTIARELGLCTGTVKTHTTAVLRALNVNTRVQAVLAAAQMGLQIDVCH